MPQVQQFTQGTGVWAVITTLIVMQTQTLGGTMHKTVNRIVGTLVASAGAVFMGAVAASIDSLTDVRHPSAIFAALCIVGVTATLTYFSSAKEWDEWSYAFFLTGLTFDFLCGDTYILLIHICIYIYKHISLYIYIYVCI